MSSPKQRNLLRHNSIAVAMRAFFAIADKWGLTPEEEMALLGDPKRSTFYNWKKGEIGQAAENLDLASRISYMLGVFQALETLYQNPDMADSWVRKPNKVFGGQSALERMAAGQMVDLAVVRDYLNSVRGGW